MITFPNSLKILVALEPCDMRKSFDGLSAIVVDHLKEEATSGALYLFTNKRHTRLKILYFDGTGLWVMVKRLEQGTFSWPQSTSGARSIKLTATALAMLTDGIELRNGGTRPWYGME
jgi:transposase